MAPTCEAVLRRLVRNLLLFGFVSAIHQNIAAASPPNDRFADRALIDSNHGFYEGDLTGAGVEPDEPAQTGRSIWWKWTAPAKGGVVLNARASALYAKGIYLYRGDSLSTLTLVGNVYGDENLQANVEAGVNYSIAVVSNGDEGRVILSFQYYPPPANDNFANRIGLSGPRINVPINLFGTTTEPGEPEGPDSFWPPFGNGAWWEWTSPANGRVAYAASAVELFEGTSLSDLRPFKEGSANWPRVSAGQKFFIRCSVFGSQAGIFNLELFVDGAHFVSPVAGTYDIEKSIPIEVGFVETDEPVERIEFYEALSEHGPLEFIKTLTHPSWRIDWQPSSPMEDRAYAAIFYASGRVTSVLSEPFNVIVVPPANDQRPNATVIPPQGGSFPVVRLSGATYEPGEVDQFWADLGASGGSAWWKWTPTQTAPATIVAPDNTIMRVFAGDAMQRVDASVIGGTVEGLVGGTNRFVAHANQTYWIGLRPWTIAPLPPSTLMVSLGSPAAVPLNDNFADRLPLSDSGLISADLGLATREEGEPGRGRSLWWTFTAAQSGFLEVAATSANQMPSPGAGAVQVMLFHGTVLNQLVPIPFTYPNWPDPTIRLRVAAGEQIVLQLICENPDGGAFLRYDFSADPSNDLFANRIAVSGLPLILEGRIIGAAGSETGEPSPFGFSKTVWWTWTSPLSGQVGLGMHGGVSVPRAAIFEGSQLSSLTRVQAVTDQPGMLIFTAEQGHEYQIQVSDYNETDFILHVSAGESSDDFANSIELTTPNQLMAGSNLNATHEAGERTRINVNSPLSGSVWWHFTAPATGQLTIKHRTADGNHLDRWRGDNVGALEAITETMTTDGLWKVGSAKIEQGETVHISWDSLVNIFGGAPIPRSVLFEYDFSSLQFALPQDRAEFPYDSAVTFSLAPIVADFDGSIDNVVFLVRQLATDSFGFVKSGQVFGPPFTQVFSNFQSGTYEVTARALNSSNQWRLSAPTIFSIGPPNDQFANRIALGSPTTAAKLELATMAGASLESFEANPAGEFRGSAWWQWQAPWSGLVYIEATNDVAVYEGTNSASLRAVASGNSLFTFTATEGEFYQMALLRRAEDTNTAAVSFGIAPAPQNDYFANRQPVTIQQGPLTSFSNELDYDVKRPTLEPGEPDHGVADAVGSIWWEFKVEQAGRFADQHFTFESAMKFRLYRGNELSQLTPVPLTTVDEYTSTADIEPGTYQIAVIARTNNLSGRITLSFRAGAPNDNLANATVLSGDSGHIETPFFFGTVEPSEPGAGTGQFVQSLWWKWTAPRSGYVDMIIPNGMWIPQPLFKFEVFQGGSLSSLQNIPVAGANSVKLGENSNSILNYAVTQGGTYYFRAAIGTELPSGMFSSFEFALSDDSVVHNDPTTAIVLEGNANHVHGNTAGSAGVVYYKWQAPQEGIVYLDTTSTNILLNARRSDWNPGIPEANVPPRSALHARAGEVYIITVSSFRPTLFDFTLDFVAGQPNDDLMSIRKLSGASGTIVADTLFSAGTFNADGQPESGRLLYYEWTAPYGGQLHIERAEGTSAEGDFFINEIGGSTPGRIIAGRSYQLIYVGNAPRTFNYWVESGSWAPVIDRGNGVLNLAVEGPADSIVRVDVSENLVDWTPFGIHEAIEGVILLTERIDHGKTLFYRLTPVW
jgi:hypothetical protein